MTNIVQIIMWILAFVPAIVLHEMGHAIAAYKLGDPTVKRNGRISFNPIRHIDPFGTVLLPLLLGLLLTDALFCHPLHPLLVQALCMRRRAQHQDRGNRQHPQQFF